MYGPSTRETRFCQPVVRLKPSKATLPSITARKATVPGVVSRDERAANGIRTRSRPSRTAHGEIIAKKPKRTANASPLRVHASRPKAAMPKSAT
jgi:hypothetical protein